MEALITEELCDQRSIEQRKSMCGRSHIGKFSSCLDEVMHGASLDFPDDTTGSVEWSVHVSMVHVSAPHVEELDGGYVLVPEGSYLVYENDQGHVTVTRYEDRDEAEREFAEQSEAYGAWLDQDESEI